MFIACKKKTGRLAGFLFGTTPSQTALFFRQR